ncbi:SlyX family protein [Paraferrimonas sedimenticola]|uniref:Protein SlyX homolog n=1 Tax=Paraferrimonas sedimenticola TaxID=375674 RepID=A0AA37RUW1_9GAMM|nr:SlyX family protein [Paraferrimonas sedimenticola]GLP95775.1 protein SlyX [Paraferrimonas sedimenticola]
MDLEQMQQWLERLESRQAFQDELIESLNQTIIKLNDQVDRQQAQIEYLGKRVAAQAPSNLAHESEETPPPHY